jgi:signal transduction histidine kinase
MRLNHKLRLALVSSATALVVLAVVFASAIALVRRSAISEEREELSAVAASVADDREPIDPAEFRESHPDMVVTVFDKTGRGTITSTASKLPPQPGFHEVGDFLVFGVQSGPNLIIVANDWTETRRGIDQLALVLWVLLLPLTLLVGAATWLAAHAVFKPLERLNRQAAEISGTNLALRLSSDDRAEFGAFAEQLNQMLARIEAAVAREEGFASDAAHELRTPLAIMRTRIETTLLQDRSPGEYVESHQTLLAEVERLTRVADALLHSAAEPQAPAPDQDAAPIVAQAVEEWQPRFEERLVQLTASSGKTLLPIPADELRIVVDNLLENALRFSSSGGVVSLTLDNRELSVADQGPGVPESQREAVFERFFRLDDHRNRLSGGSGIGLAVARRLVQGRGGTIRCEGSRFVCSWPTL